MFMKPEIWEDTMLEVETNCGAELVPDEFGSLEDHPQDENGEYDEEFCREILAYCEGNHLFSVKKEIGWFCRYMDRTDTSGPYESEQEAMEYLWEMYGDDCNTVEDVCEFSAGFADFWKGFTQCLAFTSREDKEDGSGDSLFKGGGDFDEEHPDAVDEFWPKLSEKEQLDLLSDASSFYFEALGLIEGHEEQAGVDFILTRERQGCGFWDRGVLYEKDPDGKRLTEMAHAYGAVTLMGRLNEEGEIVDCYLCY